MKSGIKVEPWSYMLRHFSDNNVDIKIEYTGIYGSDLHANKDERSGTMYPVIAGHAIAGKVIAKGFKVTHPEEGNLVGFGAQAYGCLENSCHACSRDLDPPPHCPKSVFTYNSKYSDGEQAHGAYAEATRVDAKYAFKIPASIKPAHAAPLMCAGATVFSTMLCKGVSKNDCVGIIGIGGLGHFTIQYAHVLGAEAVAILHSPNKRNECLKFGVSIFVNTANKKKVEAVSGTLNYLFVTSNSHTSQYGKLNSWMDFGSQIVLLGLPVGQLS
ncbi:hypothetical protein LPJ66_000995, partial [Kickxella alabastrina]